MTTAAGVTQLGREEFLSEYWDYRKGEHVTVLGPTDCGKTTLCYQLLSRTSTPKMPGIALVMKPRDKTAEDWNTALKYRKVSDWPPIVVPWDYAPPGYTLWPKHTFDEEIDDAHLEAVFRRCLRHSYKKGDRIIFADEIVGLTKDLHLERPVNAMLMRGRSMGVGLWSASQRPAFVPLNAYSQSGHLFLHNDPDLRSRKRFGEIGGVDPTLVSYIVGGLPKHEWLYLRRRDNVMCIVGA